MATILLVEDHPDLALHEAVLLEGAGHRVLRCSGAPGPLAACPMLRHGMCPLASAADILLFSCAMFTPTRGRSYTGEHLLRAYRAHPNYSRVPTIVVGIGIPRDLEGSGPVVLVDKFASPETVLTAVESLVGTKGPTPVRTRPSQKGPTDPCLSGSGRR